MREGNAASSVSDRWRVHLLSRLAYYVIYATRHSLLLRGRMRSSDVKTFSDGDGHTKVRQAGAAHAERKIGPIARCFTHNTDVSFETWRCNGTTW